MHSRKRPSYTSVPGGKSQASAHPVARSGKSSASNAAPGGKSQAAPVCAKATAALGGAGKLTVAIGREAAANFRAWFERNFLDPRAGRIGGASYSRAGELDDRRGDWTWYPSAYGRAFWDHTEPLKPDEEEYIRSHPLVALQLALGVTDLRGLRCLRRGLTLRANALQRKAYRSRYYARDNARRRLLAAERRKIRRRTTLNPCPTPDGFREAFAKVDESAEAKVSFGGMVHDLACYVDSCLRYDESGNIVGRNGGIRAWIAENVPELSPRYKTIMRYKALAMRVRQLAGLEDPQPTSVLLDGPDPEKREGKPEAGDKNYYAQDSHLARERDFRERDRDGLERGPDGLERGPDGPGSRRERQEVKRGRQEVKQERQEQQQGLPGPRREQPKKKRERIEPQRELLEQKQRRLGRVLAECRNTFKDVFDRIDSELGID